MRQFITLHLYSSSTEQKILLYILSIISVNDCQCSFLLKLNKAIKLILTTYQCVLKNLEDTKKIQIIPLLNAVDLKKTAFDKHVRIFTLFIIGIFLYEFIYQDFIVGIKGLIFCICVIKSKIKFSIIIPM